MKKILVALALAAVASTATALAPAHDLTTQGGSNGSCSYCHAAHLWIAGTMPTGVAPLWNRNTVTIANVYTSSTISALPVPGSNTKTCLSCHDGITNLGAINNGGLAGDMAAAIGSAIVGLDLRDDHPVGILYTVTTGAYAATTLPLPGGRVECSSCHEPHAASAAGAFLRMSRATLCASCHLK